jgi:hypothetical protein
MVLFKNTQEHLALENRAVYSHPGGDASMGPPDMADTGQKRAYLSLLSHSAIRPHPSSIASSARAKDSRT